MPARRSGWTAPLVLAMAGRAGLRHLMVVLSQDDGPVAVEAPVGLHPSPRLVAALAALFERGVSLR